MDSDSPDSSTDFDSAQTARSQMARARDRSQLLLEINNAVVSTLDLRELLKVISLCLRQVIPHDAALLTLHNPESAQLRLRALDLQMFGKVPFEEGVLISLEDTPEGQAIMSRRPVLVGPVVDLTRFSSPWVRHAVDNGVRSGCAAPLISHDRTLGALSVVSLREDAFTEADAELLSQCASQIAIAVDNALNFERARAAEQELARKLDHLRLLLQVNNAVVSQLDLHELIRVISISIREVLHGDIAGVALYNNESDQLCAFVTDFPAGHPRIEEGVTIPFEGTSVGLAFTSGQPVFIDKADPERFNSDFARRVYEIGLRSGVCAPLIAHGRKLGVLVVSNFRENVFSEDDKSLICRIADQIAIAVENSLAYREIEALKNQLNEEKLYLEDEIRTEHNFEELIGESPAFKRILKQVETVAPTDSAVLIRGETGTGKELLARAIHNLSARRERTLVKVNCAAIPMGLLESELFGHEKGAFTGAISQRIGRFELAHKGTLFLDEVGDIPIELQPKLLRVLQEQEFERLGSARTQRVDVRLIAATNSDLERMVADKKYRGDLYYRLNVFPITIPPLRERREDIPSLTRFFTKKYALRLKKRITAISSETMAALTGYAWPGNIRELEHFIERAVILTKGSELEVSLAELKSSEPVAATELSTLQEAEREHILRALKETNWVVGGPSGAAARLGMKRTTLQAKMQKLGIRRRD